MQNDSQYPSSTQPPIPTASRVGQAAGMLVVWTLVGLLGVLIASGLIALIAVLWRVIL